MFTNDNFSVKQVIPVKNFFVCNEIKVYLEKGKTQFWTFELELN